MEAEGYSRHRSDRVKQNRGYYIGEGGYGALARDVFGRANNFKLILLEYNDWQSGSFEPLCEMPQDRGVVLGLVSTKRTELEPSESLIARIEQAGRYYPGEQLALSTRCGFGTVWEGNPISQETQAAKVRLVGEVAHRVWPEGEKSI